MNEDPRKTFPDGKLVDADVVGWVAHHVNNAMVAFTPGVEVLDKAARVAMQRRARLRIQAVVDVLAERVG